MNIKRRVLTSLTILCMILTLTSSNIIRAAAAPSEEVTTQEEISTQDISEDISTEEAPEEASTEKGKFPDDYKVVFATPTDAGTPTSQLDIQLVGLYQVLVAILACLIAIITWGVFRTVYRVLTSQKI